MATAIAANAVEKISGLGALMLFWASSTAALNSGSGM
jgi:hypothetical protein